MKPLTSRFCARAVPVRPRAAAPAAPPSRVRRPMELNLSIIASSAPLAGPMAAQEAVSKLCASAQRLQKRRFANKPRSLRPSIVCKFGALHSFWACTRLVGMLALNLYAVSGNAAGQLHGKPHAGREARLGDRRWHPEWLAETRPAARR